MKIITLPLLFLLMLLLSSCATKQLSVQKPTETTAYITLVDEQGELPYRVYVNFSDTNLTLESSAVTKVYLKEGENNIQVVKKYKSASIDFVANAGKKYYFKVFTSADNNLIIMQSQGK